jgi:hypothetical protein
MDMDYLLDAKMWADQPAALGGDSIKWSVNGASRKMGVIQSKRKTTRKRRRANDAASNLSQCQKSARRMITGIGTPSSQSRIPLPMIIFSLRRSERPSFASDVARYPPVTDDRAETLVLSI